MPPFAMPVGAPLLLHIATVPFVDVDHSRPPPRDKDEVYVYGVGGLQASLPFAHSALFSFRTLALADSRE